MMDDFELLKNMSYALKTRISKNNITNMTSRSYPNLGVDPTDIAMPVSTFVLGVFSNALALGLLFYYKLRVVVEEQQSSCTHKEFSYLRRTSHSQNGENGRASIISSPTLRMSRIKFGPFHTLVLLLALFDMLGTLIISPVTFVLYFYDSHILHHGGWPLCNYSAFTMMFFGLNTMGMVMVMSLERVLSITYPYYYHKNATGKKALISVLLMSILSALISLLPSFGLGEVRPMFPYSWCFANWNTTVLKHKVFNYLYVTIGMILLFVTLTCNVKVIKGLRKMKQISARKPQSTKGSWINNETQMIIQLVSITLIFVMCWMPLITRILFNQSGMWKSSELDRISIWLASWNPIFDPWVYILFRKSVGNHVLTAVKTVTSKLCFWSSKPCQNKGKHNSNCTFLSDEGVVRKNIGDDFQL